MSKTLLPIDIKFTLEPPAVEFSIPAVDGIRPADLISLAWLFNRLAAIANDYVQAVELRTAPGPGVTTPGKSKGN